ncbi:unnamed protein product [Allacma fusca]|uniref:Peptidase S8/S53 domain-containing protein n=1 Tax=Allacma fusca TaxID=39272 RepID=A0A8J2JMD3_9HEXA|nr:unnamed protein product [Allacma fusca]
MLKLSVTILLFWFVQQSHLAPSIDSFLVKSLKDNGKVTVVVSMKDRTASFLNQLALSSFATRADRLNAVANGLQMFAEKSQGNILQILDQESRGKQFTFKSLWLTNQVIIRDADLDLIQKLSAYEEIDSITEEQVAHIEESIELQVNDNLPLPTEEFYQWGIKEIEAPFVWDEGNRGEHAIVATIDTGVRGTHEALRGNFRQEYGWYDPPFGTVIPTDNHGHGTHTTAIIAGAARNIVVAHRSRWISCRGCTASSCFQSHLLECAQWITCPTDIATNRTDCSMAPDLVSNGWVSSRGATWFADSIRAWRTAGIIPLTSIGDSGPGCGTAASPGDDEFVNGVGSTTMDNVLSTYSSVGPTHTGSNIKPDIVAPGSQVFSAYHYSDTSYGSMSGTGMASHAAGTVALIMSSEPGVNHNFELIKAALLLGSVPTTSEGKSCDGIPDTHIPNHHIGYGRINARQAINWYRKLNARGY